MPPTPAAEDCHETLCSWGYTRAVRATVLFYPHLHFTSSSTQYVVPVITLSRPRAVSVLVDGTDVSDAPDWVLNQQQKQHVAG